MSSSNSKYYNSKYYDMNSLNDLSSEKMFFHVSNLSNYAPTMKDFLFSVSDLGFDQGSTSKQFFLDLPEFSSILISSTQGFCYMGLPGVKYEAVFMKCVESLSILFSGEGYNGLLSTEFKPLSSMKDFNNDILFFNKDELLMKKCFMFIGFIMLKVLPMNYQLDDYFIFLNIKFYISEKNLFFMLIGNSLYGMSVYSKNLFFLKNSQKFFNIMNPSNYQIPCSLEDYFIDSSDSFNLCLGEHFKEFYKNYNFYLYDFSFSSNFTTHFNYFLLSLMKYKPMQSNSGGYMDFSGVKFIQFNYKNFLLKVNIFYPGGLYNDNYFSLIYPFKIYSSFISNLSVTSFQYYFNFSNNMFKSNCFSSNFKYYVKDSSYHKDNAGKKEVILEVTPDSMLHYSLEGSLKYSKSKGFSKVTAVKVINMFKKSR